MSSPTESSVPQVNFQSSKLVIGSEGPEPQQQQYGHQLPPEGKSQLDPTLLNCPPVRERFFVTKISRQELQDTCMAGALSAETDGALLQVFVLTEIDHWNNNYEKVVLLADNSIVTVKFDFVTRRYKHSRRILLSTVTKVSMGEVVFPPKSMANPRRHGAVRLYWGDPEQVGLGQRWNPFSSDSIPYLTLAHHPLHYTDHDRADPVYDVDAFFVELTGHLRRRSPGLQVCAEPVPVSLLHGLASTVFNQSGLGYSKDRNGASF